MSYVLIVISLAYTYVLMSIRVIYLHKYTIHIYRVMVRRSPPPDRDKVKIASFRISEGEWYDFSEEADRQNVTATDVIKGAIRNFMAGNFVMPEPIELIPEASTFGVGADIESLVSTAVNTAMGKLSILSVDRVTEIARGEVELGLTPLSDDLVSLQSQLAEVKSDCDLTTEGIQRLIADAISKVSIATTTAKKPTIKTALTTTEPSKDIQAKINLLEDDPKLFARVKSGIEKELSNADLGQWLDDGGFRNTKDETYKNDSVSRFRRAFEYMTSSQKGG
jgi:hypothetical protein